MEAPLTANNSGMPVNATANSVPEPVFAAFIGIDWGDEKHAWARRGTDSDVVERGTLEHRPETVQAWVAEYMARFPGQPIAVALEQKRGALLYMLTQYQQLVLFPIHPGTLQQYRKAIHPSGCKDDPLDADLALELLTKHRDRLRRLNPDTVETRTLQLLVEARRELVDQRTAQSNRLTNQLKQYFPQVLQWFDKVQSPLARAFLEKWPTLERVQRARPATLRDFMHQHNCRDAARIQERLEQIRSAIPATIDQAVIEAGLQWVQALTSQIAASEASIARLDQRIEELMAVHPDAFIFRSLPGAGPALTPRLLAAFGTQRERYTSAAELSAFSGIAPVVERSGKQEWIHFRWACPKFLRQSFHEWAGHSMEKSAWARAYYNQQRAKGNDHHAAVRALAFKWIRIIFRCWKDRKPYDEAIYMRALRTHGSPLAATIATA